MGKAPRMMTEEGTVINGVRCGSRRMNESGMLLIQRIHQFDVRKASECAASPVITRVKGRAGRARLGLHEPSTAVICLSLVRFRGKKSLSRRLPHRINK